MATKQNAWLPNFGAKGWGIVLACFVFLMFYALWNSITNSVFGIWTEQYGWAQTDMSYVVTIGGWLSLIGVVVFGMLGKKIGAKLVCTIGLIGSAIGLALLALMSNFAMYTAGVIIFYVFMVAYGTIGVGMLGSSWFPHRKGSFMGFATIGMTFASAALNPIVLAFAGSPMGVPGFFWMLAIICVIMAIVSFALIKNNPEEAGAYPDNDRTLTKEQLDAEFKAAEDYKKKSPWTLAKVLKTPQTWLIALATGIPMMVGSGLIALLVPTLIAFGQSPMFGIILLSSMWPVGLLGHYLIGVIDQKIGTKKTTIIVICILGLGGLLVFLGGTNPVVCAIATGMFLFGLSGSANVCMSLTTSVYGRLDFETAWTPISVVFNILSFAGVSVMATVSAVFGPTFVMLAAFLICCIALIPACAVRYQMIGSQMSDGKEAVPAAE